MCVRGGGERERERERERLCGESAHLERVVRLSLCMRRENTGLSAVRWNMGGQRSGGEHMARLLIIRNCT